VRWLFADSPGPSSAEIAKLAAINTCAYTQFHAVGFSIGSFVENLLKSDLTKETSLA
jgi:hypothetical protein